MTSSPEKFFEFARERHNIYLLRRDDHPRETWTDDPVLKSTRFTNIFRELDRTTIWFRQNIRDELKHDDWVVPATIIFRWFNRIETGEHLKRFLLRGSFPIGTAENYIRRRMPTGPWVTGSYMVCSGFNNGDKLSGMLEFTRLMLQWWKKEGQEFFSHRPNLQEAHQELMKMKGLAGFTAYEVVTDLRWTDAINASDRNKWAHAGPGATRGASRVMGYEYDHLNQHNKSHQEVLRTVMRELLAFSKDPDYWPQDTHDWPLWEMREVEHTLCEFDKYERVRRAQGKAKRSFSPQGPLLPSGLAV